MEEIREEQVPEPIVCQGGFRLPSLGMGNAPIPQPAESDDVE